eukprot:COSAG06_NODE_37274_length_437_cov_0.789941_1_plen_124_part_10
MAVTQAAKTGALKANTKPRVLAAPCGRALATPSVQAIRIAMINTTATRARTPAKFCVTRSMETAPFAESALEAAALVEATPVDMQTMASVMTAPTAGLPTALPAQTQPTAAVEAALEAAALVEA